MWGGGNGGGSLKFITILYFRIISSAFGKSCTYSATETEREEIRMFHSVTCIIFYFIFMTKYS